MLFWILLASLIVVPLITYLISQDGDATGVSFLVTLLVAFVGWVTAFLIGFSHNDTWIQTGDHRIELKSLNDSSAINGRGYYLRISQQRTINYVAEGSGGELSLGSVNAYEAKIFEKSDQKPNLTVYTFEKRMDWLMPWSYEVGAKAYWFTIPKGSVTESFTVDNQ